MLRLISHSARIHPCDERGHSCLNWAAALREEAPAYICWGGSILFCLGLEFHTEILAKQSDRGTNNNQEYFVISSGNWEQLTGSHLISIWKILEITIKNWILQWMERADRHVETWSGRPTAVQQPSCAWARWWVLSSSFLDVGRDNFGGWNMLKCCCISDKPTSQMVRNIQWKLSFCKLVKLCGPFKWERIILLFSPWSRHLRKGGYFWFSASSI